MRKKILIVEDEFIVANDLRLMLDGHGYAVCGIADSVAEALEMVDHEKPELVLLDIQLKGKLTGLDLAIRLNTLQIAFVYLSANSSQSILEKAKTTQPYGFLVKPFRTRDVLTMLDIALYRHDHRSELNTAVRPKPSSTTEFPGVIGESKKWRDVFDQIRQVAPTDASVLLLGESGTGKELIANCIHELSPRRLKPFVKVNCAALHANLVESELFGHEKGAFTGASDRRIGKFEQASGGTILLDEIGEMPPEMQLRLLRVLQEKEIERIGGAGPMKIDVRIIAATNRVLEKEVAEGRFRLDLYYRLYVFPILLPPLRERTDDIPALVMHFIDLHSRKLGKDITGVTPHVIKELISYHWPGNIRELEHIIERSILLTKTPEITEVFIAPLQPHNPESGKSTSPIRTSEENERDHILAALKACHGKIHGPGGAAEILGVPPTTLSSRMKKLGIKKDFY